MNRLPRPRRVVQVGVSVAALVPAEVSGDNHACPDWSVSQLSSDGLQRLSTAILPAELLPLRS